MVSRVGVRGEVEAGIAWSDTPLGPVTAWPERLRVLVGVHAHSDLPSCLFWGAESIMIPNPTWEREVGPQPMRLSGRPAAELSAELDRACRAALDGTAPGEVSKALLPLLWRSFVDRPFAGLSCAPVLDDAGRAEGLLVQLGLAPGGAPEREGKRDAHVRTDFMLRLSDALRRLDDADAVQELGTRMLGEQLGADRASFSEVDFAAGRAWERHEYLRDPAATSHAVDHELADFGPAIQLLRNGLPLVIDDMLDAAGAPADPVAAEVAHYAHAPFRAQLTVPVLRAGELVSVITIRHDRPHRWAVAEIATAHEAGIRIWEAIERARAEAGTRLSEARFRALVSATSRVSYRMSPDWSELWHLDGRGFLEDVSEPVEHWLTQYIHPDERDRVMAAVRVAVATREVFEMEHRVRHPDGSFSWVWSRAVPILDTTGGIMEWFGATTDITDRKDAEEALRTREERFRALVTATSQIVYRMSPDWREMRQLHGVGVLRDTTEPSTEWLADYIDPADQPQVLAAIRKAIETRSLFELEHRVRRADGSLGWVLSRAVPLLDAAGEVREWFGAASDVTARREAEEAVRQAAARRLSEARAAEGRKARLMAVLAHDLRTPLVAVLGALELVREGQDAAARVHVLERIERDGHGMLQLIDDVLELARLGAGELRLRPEPFDAAALLDEVADLVRAQAARNGTEVVTEAEGTPPLFGDVTALRRVLTNFATNAVKATEGGGIRLSATAGAPDAEGHSVTFAVTDTGRGIAPGDIPRLFRDFGMLDREDADAGGTGLGLAICRRLATAMGGEVGVESTPGVGSRFWLRVTLPEAAEAPEAPPRAEDPAATLAGLRVLVAEDHETIRRITCTQLARSGARPVEAADGLEAVERAAAEPFDLILMDLRLPGLDGPTAAARIRQNGGPSAGARIVGLTARRAPATVAMLSDLALDACLAKPLDLARLAAVLRDEAVAAERPPADPLIDPATLAELRALDGGALLARALARFSREIAALEPALAARLAAGDAPGAGRLAHRLAGAGDILGARPLADALRAFEIRTEIATPAALRAALAELAPVLQATRAAAAENTATDLHDGPPAA